MNSLALIPIASLVIGLAVLVIAKWSVVMMVRQINRKVESSECISLMWWPTYKDRRVLKLYHSVLPQGHLNILYISCLGGGLAVLFLAVFLASRVQL
jgi:hypothetical protein